VRIGQIQPKQNLREVVAARRKLVQDLALGQELGFLDVIEGAGQ
jgi:hypothetical protein